MKSKIDIQKMIGSLTGKERAKMMVLDFDEEFASGKGNLSKEERNTLRTLNNPKERAEYAFYFDLRFDFASLIVSGIESSTLRFAIGYLNFVVDIFKNDKEPEPDRVERIRDAMQGNYNLVYSYKEIADLLVEKYDFPVLGGYHKFEVEFDLDGLEVYKQKMNNIYSACQQAKNSDDEKDASNFIKEKEIDKIMVEDYINIIKSTEKNLL